MKLYLLAQNKNTDYDTFDSCVVAAPDEVAARLTHPRGKVWTGKWWAYPNREASWLSRDDTWVEPDDVTVVYLGDAAPDVMLGVVCASFNAG
jgi:hypothetical protein